MATYKDISNLSQEDVIAYLAEQYPVGSSLSGWYGVGDQQAGTNYYYDPTPWGGNYYFGDQNRAYLTNVFDPAYEQGVYGSYWAPTNEQGVITGAPQFAKAERSGSWFSENLSTVGPLSVLALIGAGAAMYGFGGSAAGGVAAADKTAALDAFISSLGPANELKLAALNGLDFSQVAAPIVESAVTKLGPAATLKDFAQYMGIPNYETIIPASLATKKLVDLGITPGNTKDFLTRAWNTVSKGITNDGSINWGNILGGAATGAIGAFGVNKAMDALRNTGDWGNEQYRNLGTEGQQQYNDLADWNQNQYGMFGGAYRDQMYEWAPNNKNMYEQLGLDLGQKERDAAQTGADRINAFADNMLPLRWDVRDNYTGQYQDLAAQVRDAVGGEFKPYSITTNIGSTNKDTFTPTPGIQRVSDQATTAAGNAFAAANSYDLNNMRMQNYNLMKAGLAPGDQQARIANEERLRKQGRLDVAGGQGYNPQTYALEQGLANRDVNLMYQADQQARNAWLQTLQGGNTALQAPMSIDAAGRGMLQLGGSLGQMASGENRANTNTWAPYAQKAIDYPANFDDRTLEWYQNTLGKGVDYLNQGDQQAIDREAPLFTRGLDNFWEYNTRGLNKWADLSAEGIGDATRLRQQGISERQRQFAQGIATKFKSEREAVDALVNIYNAIAGGARSMFGGGTGGLDTSSFGSAMTGIIKWFKDQGMSENDAFDYIDTALDNANNYATGWAGPDTYLF